MTTRTIVMLTSFMLVLTMLVGCATNVAVKPQPLPICKYDFHKVFQSITPAQSDSILQSAETGGCWKPAITEALQAQAPISETELVKALKFFNRSETAQLFDLAAASYLTNLAAGQIAYGNEQRQFLEAYSRNAINKAHRQNTKQLRLIQQVSWRVDRALYARLFE